MYRIYTAFDRLIIRLNFFGCFKEIHFNGVYHCFSIFKDERGQLREIIVSFDMRDEMFRTIRMPVLSDISNDDIEKALSVLSNCLTSSELLAC